ncbi:MAG TPA: glycosyltransferase, partial [Thermopetrobacter sp.]|nr:glycosyltransferase [Thermopetrobacter sp.]
MPENSSRQAGPAVSVIMPVFNGASHVEDAVLSILGQTFGDFEFIIIDDGSTDGAGEILARLAAGDSRIVLMRRENRGIVASLNEGLARARAPLIARMDADDVASPQRLELQARAFARRPSLVLLGGQARMIDGDGRPRRRLLMPVGAERVRATLLRTCPFIHPAVMFRRRTALDIGGYRAAF